MGMTLDVEVKNDNRVVEGWLLWYHERKTDYLNDREAILSSPGPNMNGSIRGSDISDPTGSKGQKLGDLKQAEEWLKLIEEVEARLPWKLEIFLHLRREYRYASGRNGWVAGVQWKFAEEVAKQLNKKPAETWVESRSTFWAWWNQIVDYTTVMAAKRGLLE